MIWNWKVILLFFYILGIKYVRNFKYIRKYIGLFNMRKYLVIKIICNYTIEVYNSNGNKYNKYNSLNEFIEECNKFYNF